MHMGLFDRIKGNEEEVELRPPAGAGEDDVRLDAGDAGGTDDGDEPFLLPGMEPSGTVDDEPEPRRSRSRRDRTDGAKMERIIDQNERIIELLEQLAGDDDSIWG